MSTIATTPATAPMPNATSAPSAIRRPESASDSAPSGQTEPPIPSPVHRASASSLRPSAATPRPVPTPSPTTVTPVRTQTGTVKIFCCGLVMPSVGPSSETEALGGGGPSPLSSFPSSAAAAAAASASVCARSFRFRRLSSFSESAARSLCGA